MRYFTLFLFSVVMVNYGFSKNEGLMKEPKDTVGLIITMDGNLSYMMGNVEITDSEVEYHSGDGRKEVDQTDIKFMFVYDRVFISLPRRENGEDLNLLEVLAISGDYILAQYWDTWYYYYVYDHDGQLESDYIKVYDRNQTIGAKRNNRKAMEELDQYFGDCDDLMDAFQKNYNEDKILSTGISNITCGHAPSIKEILMRLKDKPWYDHHEKEKK